jgi:hypothetical protein
MSWIRFGLFRFRSPLLSESRFLSFPAGTEMVHFPAFALARLFIQRVVVRVYRTGFPHSEIPGSKPACGSPRLIAACHVLHRLLLPRHPPCALSNLTIKFTPRMPHSPCRKRCPRRVNSLAPFIFLPAHSCSRSIYSVRAFRASGTQLSKESLYSPCL